MPLAYGAGMATDRDQNPPAADNRVSEKQLQRWKDEGGALPPEPDPARPDQQDEMDQQDEKGAE